jgi:hypothetical protein
METKSYDRDRDQTGTNFQSNSVRFAKRRAHFSRGVKTSSRWANRKPQSPYDRTRKYRKGQAMMHSTFGQGEVTAVIEPQKIDVLFGDRRGV